jgi:plasmid stabilization system protein ParE
VKWRLVIRPRAESDLRDARSWYQNQRTGLGDQFLAQIAIALEFLIRDPNLHPEYYRGFRRVMMRRFPYKLFYRIEGERIIVFRVLHSGRDHPKLLPRHRG